MPPNGVSIQEGADTEDVLLMRDELANMAWGMEHTVTGRSGAPVDRSLAVAAAAPVPAPLNVNAAPSYLLGISVPGNWIPFLPVTVDSGPLELRRGTLPRSANAPLGRFLAYPGLTIFLEELPREGVRLEQRYRCARGPDGSTWLWLGRRRSTGKGEGRSGLQFDAVAY